MREIVKDRRLFGVHGGSPHASGVGNLVYIADAHFIPHGETRLHGHREIDIVTLVLKGRIRHQGTLGDGTTFDAYEVQVQRAGGEGLLHNEINPDGAWNHVVQVWLLPEQRGQRPEYRVIEARPGSVTRVYGGADASAQAMAAATRVDIVRLGPGQLLRCDGPVQLYLAEGRGGVGAGCLEAGDLVSLHSPCFTAVEECTLIALGLVQTLTSVALAPQPVLEHSLLDP